jgi:hypothetical protein
VNADRETVRHWTLLVPNNRPRLHCAQHDNPFIEPSSPHVPDPSIAPSPSLADASLAQQLATALKQDPAFDAVEATVQQGWITLSGVVRDLRAKYHAEFLASQLPGVVDIENLLKVRPPEPPER